MSWLIYILLTCLPLVYWYLTRNHSYWIKRGVKGPKPLPGFGNILDIFITPQTVQDVRYFKNYGKIYGYFIGNRPVLTVADPDLIKTIMVKDFHLFPNRRPKGRIQHPITSKNLLELTGDDWKRVRSICTPTFTSGKMKRMFPLIRDCICDFANHLDTFASTRADINAKDMYGNLTMDVIARCAFATKTNVHKELDSPFVVNARKIFNFSIFQLILALSLPSNLLKLLPISIGFSGSGEARDFFLDNTRHIIESRRKSGQKSNDFLQLLIDANKRSGDTLPDENDNKESHHVNDGKEELDVEHRVFNVNLIDKHLTEAEILAQAFVFLLAGYETTATALTYCTYELALQPALQERLCREVKSAMDSNGELSYEVLAGLPFLDAVLSEALRLHSPVLRLSRIVNTKYELGNTGITLEKGQQVEVSIYAIHHCEEFYPDPFKFDPDRFMPENRHLIKPYTYLPFGAGPRNCIGMRFALLEAKLALAHIVTKFKFFRSPQTDVPLLPKRVFRLNTPKRIIVGIERRI